MKTFLFILFLTVFLLFENQPSFAVQFVKFKATDAAKQKSVSIDSVLINNITQKLMMTVKTDSADIDMVTGINENNQSDNPKFVIAGYPNPFESSTDFKVYISDPSDATFTLFDIIGNKIMTKSEFLDNGIHQFTLNGNGLIQGSYYMMVNGNNRLNILKLVKTGNSSGTAPFINSSLHYPEIIYNGKESGAQILIVNNNIYSFTCYSKNYWTLNSGDKSGSDLKTNNVINFLLTSSKKYDINGGTIDIGGFSYKYKHDYSSLAPPNDQNNGSTVYSNNFNINYYLQNLSLPLDPSFYESFYGVFLNCYNALNDNLSIDFCYKFYNRQYDPNYGGTCTSNSNITYIKFNPNYMLIDTIILTFYRYFVYLPIQITVDHIEEKITSSLILYNLPFSIDSLKNLFVDLKGNTITDYLKMNYNRNYYAGHGAYRNTEDDTFMNIVSVSDSAHIKIVLTP